MLLVSVVMVMLAGLIPSSADKVTEEPATAAPDPGEPRSDESTAGDQRNSLR
jgi:hypothetical protein